MNKRIIKSCMSVFATLVAILLVFSIGLITASAEEISPEAKSVIELIEKLPANPDMITLENKNDIIAANEAFNALDLEQQLEIPIDKMSIINKSLEVLSPLLLGELSTAIEELPELKDISDGDKDKIIDLYTSYSAMDDATKIALAKELSDKFLLAVNKVSPDSLNEEDAKTVAEIDVSAIENGNEKAAKTKVNFQTVWQYALIAFVSVIVLFSFAALLVLLIKIFKMMRK